MEDANDRTRDLHRRAGSGQRRALLIESTRLLIGADEEWPRTDLFRQYGGMPDEQRLRFYLHLDPLTW